MKKVVLSILALLVGVALCSPAFAGGSSKPKTRYPIVLVHGWAGSALYLNALEYFYGIPEEIEDEIDVAGGVFVANNVDAFNTDNVRGAQLRAYVLYVLNATGAQKVNIIGHSMGGTTARYMVSCFSDMSSKVASITTVSTPHRGTSAAHLILKINDGTMGALSWIMDNLWGRIASGDERSRFIAATQQLTPEGMAVVNTYVRNIPGVAYLSYATKYYGVSPAALNNILYPFYCWMRDREGDNDGVVPVSSMIWGDYRGQVTGLFGCDHVMIVNHLFGITPGMDAKGFYVDLAELLGNRGY